ncbi:MAG TPA: DJ-1/PfpI family protein [Actinomycetota bacterium]
MGATRTTAFVLYPGLTPLDLVGPLQVMSVLERFAPECRAIVVGERVEPMETDAGISIVPQATFEEVPEPRVVVVPGGGSPTIRQMGNEVVLDYLRRVADRAEVVASVCTGALLLAAAGLLEGRRATTHWGYHALLERLGATYVPERWVDDPPFLTSAGVSAGIDMGLELAARVADVDRARLVQLGIEYDPRPPFGPIDWSTVDRDVLTPLAESSVRTELADRPHLQRRLLPEG